MKFYVTSENEIENEREINRYYKGLDVTINIEGVYKPATYLNPPEYPEITIMGVEVVDAKEFAIEFADNDEDNFNEKYHEAMRDYEFSFGNLPNTVQFDYNGVRFVLSRDKRENSLFVGDMLNAKLIVTEAYFIDHYFPDNWKAEIVETVSETQN